MAKILHTADIHLGFKFENLPENLRENAQKLHIYTLHKMVEMANANSFAAILIAGDLFHIQNVPALLFMNVMSILSKADMPVFISPGNHDYFYTDSPIERFVVPDNVHFFKKQELECVELADFNIYGAAFLAEFADINLDTLLSDDRLNICVLHGDLLTNSQYNPINAEKLKNCTFDYLALGHNHSFSGVKQYNNTIFAAPGCPMGTGFDETGEKGYLVLEINDNNIHNLEFIALNGISFETINIVTDEKSEEQLIQIISAYSDRSLCAKFILSGVLNFKLNIKNMTNQLLSKFFHLELVDETTAKIDFWQFKDLQGLCGEYVRILHKEYENTDDLQEKELILHALEIGVEQLLNN